MDFFLVIWQAFLCVIISACIDHSSVLTAAEFDIQMPINFYAKWLAPDRHINNKYASDIRYMTHDWLLSLQLVSDVDH